MSNKELKDLPQDTKSNVSLIGVNNTGEAKQIPSTEFIDRPQAVLLFHNTNDGTLGNINLANTDDYRFYAFYMRYGELGGIFSKQTLKDPNNFNGAHSTHGVMISGHASNHGYIRDTVFNGEKLTRFNCVNAEYGGVSAVFGIY